MSDVLHAALGKEIREFRESSKLTQDELAKRMHVSRTSLTNMEAGRQRVLIDQLYLVARALEVGPEDLLPSPKDLAGPPARNLHHLPIPDSVQRFMQSVKIENK